MYKNDNNNHDFITDAVTPCMTGGVESRNDNEHKDIVERDARKAGVEQELEAVASGRSWWRDKLAIHVLVY